MKTDETFGFHSRMDIHIEIERERERMEIKVRWLWLGYYAMTNEVELFSWICDYQIENSILILLFWQAHEFFNKTSNKPKCWDNIETICMHEQRPRSRAQERKRVRVWVAETKKKSVPKAKNLPKCWEFIKYSSKPAIFFFFLKFPTAAFLCKFSAIFSTSSRYFRSSICDKNSIPFDLSLMYWITIRNSISVQWEKISTESTGDRRTTQNSIGYFIFLWVYHKNVWYRLRRFF